MKKIIFASVIAAMFLFTASQVQAQDNTLKAKDNTQQTVKGPRFVDANNDGICDNRDNPNKERMYKNRDGNCDGKQFKKGKGKGNCRGNKQGFRGKGNR